MAQASVDHVVNGVDVKSDAPREQIEELVALAQARSPVFNRVAQPVEITAELAG